MADARSLVARVFPHNQVGLALGKRGTTTILSVYNLHLACLFPQHGRGIKHKRPIVLEQWQEARSKPHRGLSFGLHTVRWLRIINRTGPYAYLSYGSATTRRTSSSSSLTLATSSTSSTAYSPPAFACTGGRVSPYCARTSGSSRDTALRFDCGRMWRNLVDARRSGRRVLRDVEVRVLSSASA